MVHMESFDKKNLHLFILKFFVWQKLNLVHVFYFSELKTYSLYCWDGFIMVLCFGVLHVRYLPVFNDCFKLNVIIAISTKKINVHSSKWTFYFTIHVPNRKYNDQRRKLPIDYVQMNAYVVLLKYGKHFVVVRRVFRKQSLSSLLSLLEKTLFQGRDFVLKNWLNIRAENDRDLWKKSRRLYILLLEVKHTNTSMYLQNWSLSVRSTKGRFDQRD